MGRNKSVTGAEQADHSKSLESPPQREGNKEAERRVDLSSFATEVGKLQHFEGKNRYLLNCSELYTIIHDYIFFKCAF